MARFCLRGIGDRIGIVDPNARFFVSIQGLRIGSVGV